MRRLISNLSVSAVIFLLPLVGSAAHLAHPAPWLGLLCGAVMLSSQPRLDRQETLALSAADRGSALAIFFAMIAAQLGAVAQFRSEPASGPGVAFALGAAIVVVGMALRLWSIRVLGRFFTANVRVVAGQHVVRSGPYACVRHPSYTGALLAAFGTAIALGSPLGVGCVIALGVPAYLYRIAVEEERLAVQIGRPYRNYMQRTHRLVPGVY